MKKVNLENINSPEFGEIFDNAFNLYKKAFAPILLGIIIVAAIAFALYFLLFFLFFGGSFLDVSSDPDFVRSLDSNWTYILVTNLFALMVALIFAPITAGFYKICSAVAKGEPAEVGLIFSYYKQPYINPIVTAALLVSLVSVGITIIAQFLGMPFLAYPFSVIISVLTIFMYPLIIFRDYGASEAITDSIKIAGKHFFMILLLLVIGIICAMLGLIACIIGVLFTLPFMYTLYYAIYDGIIGDSEESEIDQIGISE